MASGSVPPEPRIGRGVGEPPPPPPLSHRAPVIMNTRPRAHLLPPCEPMLCQLARVQATSLVLSFCLLRKLV